MIGAIIGAATSVAGGILGAISSSNARKRAAKVLDERERRAQGIYNRDYNQDYTQTASAQSALAKGRDILNQQVQKVEGSKAVMGGTDESVASAKQSANDAMGDATAKVAEQGEKMQAQATQNYQNEMANIDNARIESENNSAKYAAQAGSQVMNAGMKLASTDIDAHMDGKGGVFENMFGLYNKNKKANG